MSDDFLNDELSEKKIEKIKKILSNMSNKELINLLTDFSEYNFGNHLSPKYIYWVKELKKRYCDWSIFSYKNEIIESLNLYTDLDSKTLKNISNIIQKYNTPKGYFYRLRIFKATIKKFLYKIPTVNSNNITYITTAFAINTSKSSNETIYAFLYTKINPDILTKYEHQYICIGPSLLSSDGEYRSKFITIKTFNLIKLEYSKLFNKVEKYLMNKVNINFNKIHYFTENFKYKNNFKEDVENNRFSINLYILSWLSQGFLKYLNLQNKHIDKNYNINMFNSEDNVFIKRLFDEYKTDYLKIFYLNSSQMVDVFDSNITNYKIPILPHIYIGQKIIPINSNIKNISNIKIPAFRELYVSKKVSDLVVNNICNGFSIYYTNFKINNIDKRLFNNTNIWKAFSKNDRLDTICCIVEHTGRTINDIENLYKSKTYRETNLLLFDHLETFNTYIFNIIYSLYCLNSKLNIIHGDLHLNNTTIYDLYKKYLYDTFPEEIKQKEKIRHSLYIINDNMFIQRYKHKIGTIIDFSRCFIIPEEKEHYLYFKETQSKRIVNYYDNLFPNFIKTYRKKLLLKLDNQFECVYKVFTAVDIYMHVNELIKYIKYYKLKYSKSVMDLLISIKGRANYHLVDIMKKIILETDTDKNSIIFPNYDIIMHCFQKCKISNKELNQKLLLDNVFVFNKKLKYSINNFELLPEEIKYTKILHKENVTIYNKDIGYNQNLYNFYGKTFISDY